MKQVIPFIILLIFIAILVLANNYLARRFTYYFDIVNTKTMYYVFAAITISMIGSLAAFTNATSIFGNYTYSIAAIFIGIILYLILTVFVVEIINLAVKIQPLTRGIVAISLALIVSAYGIWNATYKQVRTINIPVKNLTEEIRVMHLTDIHIGHFWGPKTLTKIVDLTNKQNPDIVFITGDLFDGKIRLSEKSLEPLKHLKAPVYFVEGNHDGYSGAAEIKKKVRNTGVTVLENDVTHFGELQIIGLNHMLADNNAVNMHATETRSTISSTLDSLNINPQQPTVLLHHSPDGIKYANKHGVDVYLAGHTHAGQLFPINYIAGLMFDYNKGLHDYNGTKIYVSQGAGTFGPPMRVGTISELSLLVLTPQI